MSKYLKIHDPTRGNTLANWKAYLAAQKSAGTPVRILADLPSPMSLAVDAKEIDAHIGYNKFSANSGPVTIRSYKQITSGYFLKSLPLMIKVNGADLNDTTNVFITRNGSYNPTRPYGFEENGYDGETIVSAHHLGDGSFSLPNDNNPLIGRLDDGAKYYINAEVVDDIGQVATATQMPFTVHWTNQARMPGVEIEPDFEKNIAYITPTAPNGTTTGSTADIYRLSIDKPELIYKGATFGHQYVDPYPALGEFGGYRVVYKTKEDDYVTELDQFAWVDINSNMDIWGVIIDFDGRQLHLNYDISLGNKWEKDFTRTSYLGGSVQGDWNPAILRDLTVKTNTIVEEDTNNIRLLRELAEYAGICHIRTPDGSSFAADIQVKEDRDEKMINQLAKFTMEVKRVDSETPDAMTIEEWMAMQVEESNIEDLEEV